MKKKLPFKWKFKERTKYKSQFDIASLAEGFSGTLMELLSELKRDKLPAVMICNLIHESIINSFMWTEGVLTTEIQFCIEDLNFRFCNLELHM